MDQPLPDDETAPEPSIAPQRILVIDDEKYIGLGCRRALSPDGHYVEVYEDPQAGLQAALNGGFDIVFVDLRMPDVEGMEILRQLKAAAVASEVVIITGHATIETAVESIRHGAADYLAKPFSPAELRLVLQRVAQRSALVRENTALRQELELNHGFEGIIGESTPMQRVFSLIKRVAPTDGTVLITGESGTGKEMIVRAIHRLSRRKGRPLLACDCSALAPTLLESELFGHVKGSFSGAVATKQGLFEAAHKGTLFLDEIANLSMEIQGKLLRALESKKVRKVGDTGENEINIRLVTATNRDLADMVADGVFREDLYYRLNVVPIYLPPLRLRQGDIPLLTTTFLKRLCEKHGGPARRISAEAMCQMESYEWPGNVRELRNIVERLVILCDSDVIQSQHLPAELRQATPQPKVTQLPHSWDEFRRFKSRVKETTMLELDRRFVTEALDRSGGNVSRAAEAVGLNRPNFHALMRKCGVTAERGEGS
jgi:DNA-binding NtrC family response regulator